MVTLAFTHAILSTAIFVNPFQAVDLGLVQKEIVAPSPVSTAVSAERHWSFAIANYRMQHQQGWQTLNIAIDCASNQVDLVANQFDVYGEVAEFLRNYPNEDDYWEIINRELTKTILYNHPELSSISLTLEVLPTHRIPYTRASIVSRNRNGESHEKWRFEARVPVQIQGDDLKYEVEYLYRNGITNTEYPDFVTISDRIAQLLMTAVNKGEPWEYANQDIAEIMLQKYPALDTFTSRIEHTIKGGYRRSG